MPKRNWEKPKLIVLVRRKPEEAILAGCKNGASGPGEFDTGCYAISLCAASCDSVLAS